MSKPPHTSSSTSKAPAAPKHHDARNPTVHTTHEAGFATGMRAGQPDASQITATPPKRVKTPMKPLR